jgi:hypothetical protein
MISVNNKNRPARPSSSQSRDSGRRANGLCWAVMIGTVLLLTSALPARQSTTGTSGGPSSTPGGGPGTGGTGTGGGFVIYIRVPRP